MGNVGVVVARFQGPDLHEGHQDLINYALKENGKLLIILGNSHLINTIPDPLDYPTRVKMIHGKYPNAIVTFLRRQATDDIWAGKIDRIISELCPTDKPTLYWGRDSSISSYRDHGGKHRCKEVTSFHQMSSTELREAAGKVVLDERGFRVGIIYCAYNKFPTIRVTVDIAIIRGEWTDGIEKLEIVLGKKHDSPYWCIPGGFVDKKDKSFLEAAQREKSEEVPTIEVGDWDYVGSYRVDDWRYIGVEDEYIMTNLFICRHLWGTLAGGDDLPEVEWFKITDVIERKIDIVECHKVLIDALSGFLETKKNVQEALIRDAVRYSDVVMVE